MFSDFERSVIIFGTCFDMLIAIVVAFEVTYQLQNLLLNLIVDIAGRVFVCSWEKFLSEPFVHCSAPIV